MLYSNQLKRMFLASIVLGVVALSSHAQQTHTRRFNPNLTERSFQRLILDWKWTQRDWTGDEAPYRAANAQIVAAKLDAKVKAGQDPVKLLAPYKQAVVENADSPLTAYKWALATFYATKHAKPQVTSQLWNNTFPLLHHFQEPQLYSADEPWFTLANTGKLPKAPHSYWFDRMMFIAAVENGVYQVVNFNGVDRLNVLADRLTQRNPKDREVQLRQIKMLQNSRKSRTDNTWSLLAVKKAQNLVSQNPKEYRLLLPLVEAYRYVGDDWGKPVHSQMALKTYQKYLGLFPKDSAARRMYQDTLDTYNRTKERTAKYKTREAWLASLSHK